jgi:hypothetical protein
VYSNQNKTIIDNISNNKPRRLEKLGRPYDTVLKELDFIEKYNLDLPLVYSWNDLIDLNESSSSSSSSSFLSPLKRTDLSTDTVTATTEDVQHQGIIQNVKFLSLSSSKIIKTLSQSSVSPSLPMNQSYSYIHPAEVESIAMTTDCRTNGFNLSNSKPIHEIMNPEAAAVTVMSSSSSSSSSSPLTSNITKQQQPRLLFVDNDNENNNTMRKNYMKNDFLDNYENSSEATAAEAPSSSSAEAVAAYDDDDDEIETAFNECYNELELIECSNLLLMQNIQESIVRESAMNKLAETRKALENIFVSVYSNMESNQFPKLDSTIIKSISEDSPRKPRSSNW